MANKEKLEQLIEYIKKLTTLTEEIYEREIYPVSFFSQAYDLTNTIQEGLHQIEIAQIELFERQMKEHQAQILSIVPYAAKKSAPDTPTPPATELPAPPATESRAPSSTELPAPPPTGFSAPATTGFSAPPPPELFAQPKTESPSPPSTGLFAQPETQQEATPAYPNQPVETRAAVTEPPPYVPPRQETVSPSTTNSPTVNPPKETSLPASPVQDMKRIITNYTAAGEKNRIDLQKIITLNDRFLFCRELFSNDENLMNRTVADLNKEDTFEASMDYIKNHFNWNPEAEYVADFIACLKKRFA